MPQESQIPRARNEKLMKQLSMCFIIIIVYPRYQGYYYYNAVYKFTMDKLQPVLVNMLIRSIFEH